MEVQVSRPSLLPTEHVTARTPYPDERTALGLNDASPLLITYRITADAGQDRPLLWEELKAPAVNPASPASPGLYRAGTAGRP